VTASALYSSENTPKYAITPEEMMISPTRFSLSALFFFKEISQFTSSSPSFSMRDFALLHFFSASSN
jgi:hypothetical protein